MCGIIGYIGQQEVLPVLVDGLKKMEYRGYDSSGIAVISDGDIQIHKKKGRIDALERSLDGINGSYSDVRIGIGHTRWATHGEPNEANAHPHLSGSGDIAIIHNGIIENNGELRQLLLEKGHTFRSDTDSEVLAHLIDEEYDGDLELAVVRSLLLVQGTYGLTVIHKSTPDRMVVARMGSPLVVGIGVGENFVASDLSAMVQHTRDVIFLEDGEVGTVTLDGFHHTNLDHAKIQRPLSHIDFSLEQIEKGGYKHFMLKEIMEQPKTLSDTMRGRISLEEGNVRLGGLETHLKELEKAERIILLACGTSYHAGLVGEYLIEEWAGIPVEVEYASEFRYRSPIIPKNTVAFAISQSGETLDTLEALREAKRNGALDLGIVNTVGSTIARESTAGVYLHAGPEIGVASTKAFTSQVTVLAMIAVLLGRQRNMTAEQGREILGSLQQVPEQVKSILTDWTNVEDIAKTFSRSSNFLYLGRGPNFPVALEGALKLKEISYIHAEGYPAAEMKHGPIALIDRQMPVVCVATKDHTYQKVVSNIEEVRSRDGVVITIVNEDDERMSSISEHIIRVPNNHPMLMPLLSSVPLQLLAYRIADLLGWDVDKPRNLAKSVTVE